MRKLPVGTTKVDGFPCWKAVKGVGLPMIKELRYEFVQCEGDFVRTDTLHECIKEEIELNTLKREPDDLS